MNLDALFSPYKPVSTHVVDSLKYWAENTPDKLAYRFLTDGEDEQIDLSYAELDRCARSVASKLSEHDVRGERVLLLHPPGIAFAKAFWGCLYAGAIAVPAYPPRRHRGMNRIEAIVDDAKAIMALSTVDAVERAKSILKSTDSPLNRIMWIGTDSIADDYDPEWETPEIKPSDLAVFQYTSGSTGSPKGVMLAHENIIANCRMITKAFQSHHRDFGMAWLPVYHDMGLVGGLLNPIFTGLSALGMSPMAFLQKPVRWLQAITKHKITITGGPNFAYDLCTQKVTEEEMEGLDLSSLSIAYNGAEPIRSSTLEEFSKKFAKVGFDSKAFYPCYGMAEATLIITGAERGEPHKVHSFDADSLHEHRVVSVPPDADNARHLVSCGRILDKEEVIIVDTQTYKQLPAGEVGEIWVCSPSVGKGYWNKPGVTEQTFEAKCADSDSGPFLRTGDLGFLMDGELYVTGRLKDLIIVRGVNRYPQDIELTVERASNRLQNGAVGAFAVDIDGRERLIVVAETERKRHDDWSDVIQKIRMDVTAEHDLPPDGIVLVRFGSIPKTSSGKIQRHGCRKSFRDGSLKTIAQWFSWDDASELPAETIEGTTDEPVQTDLDETVLETVYDHVKAIAQERANKLSPGTNIVIDLGLDSLERLQIANSLEETYGGRFPEEVLQEIETCGEVAAAVQQYIGTVPAKDRRLSSSEPKKTATKAISVPEENYTFALMPEYKRLKQTMSLLDQTGVPNPYFSVHDGVCRDTTIVDGKELLSFTSYNYIGMSGDPQVTKACQDATERYGTSVSASRVVSGQKSLHEELESSIAAFIGVEDAITYVGGFSTNESTIGHIVGSGDLILHDSLSHNSIIQGSILSGARRRPFAHNDWQELDEILNEVRGDYRRVLIIVEGVYSMDGDFPDLPRFVEVKNRHKVMLMVDEAHSMGTMGPHGRGISEHFNVDPREVDIWMGTLSKSFGSCGGYIAGTRELIEYLKYTSPGFVYSVGLSPPNAAAALASLRVLESEPERVGVLQQRSKLFLDEAKKAGLNTGLGNNTPVVPVIIGNSVQALQLSHQLFECGINVQPILYPAVEESATRLRFFITSCHSEQQIVDTVRIVAEEVTKIDPGLLVAPVKDTSHVPSVSEQSR